MAAAAAVSRETSADGGAVGVGARPALAWVRRRFRSSVTHCLPRRRQRAHGSPWHAALARRHSTHARVRTGGGGTPPAACDDTDSIAAVASCSARCAALTAPPAAAVDVGASVG